MMEQRPLLEPIQEESEQEDETEENKTEDEEERDFKVQLDMETEDVMAEVESQDEDDDAPLRVMRPRRLSRSLSYESFPQMQSTVSDLSTIAVDRSDEASPPSKPNLVFKKWSTSGELGIMVSKTRWQKHKRPQSVPKKTRSERNTSQVDEPFPQWLVKLMVNIEEATTHQLVVE
ncbi:hypothetical protein PAMP_004952 [Pampus punctatissimus]